MSKTFNGLIDFAKSKIGVVYIYGSKGQVLTRSQIKALQDRYGKNCVWDSDLNKAGQVSVDCSGLISWYTGIVRGSMEFKNSASQVISISQRSNANIGWAVWMQGHIGIYLGNNQYIAADGSAYGVRIANLNQNGFTHLLKLCDIDYSSNVTSNNTTNSTNMSALTVGTSVIYSSCYVSSTDPNSKAIIVNGSGKITNIKSGARNPYLIDGGKCWCNSGDIRSINSSSEQKSTVHNSVSASNSISPGSYKTLVVLNVRTGAGTNFAKKAKSQLTSDGQKHSNASGALNIGTVVTVKAVKVVDGNTWVQTPSGWLAAIYNGETYIART